ncbi:unnamed protein product [Lactuca virosa]|uniref:Uncharacterized protein n=1 Tax=Lactuca virosa TaxID=75947 RepID=A0AAU9PI05_9ASTR|nr:unnamed protein product [Lactuca virosa]
MFIDQPFLLDLLYFSVLEERGTHFHDKFDMDEETKDSSVFHGGGVDDSGYDESEDVFDSQNSETFGDVVNENELYPFGSLDVEMRIQDNQQHDADTEKHMANGKQAAPLAQEDKTTSCSQVSQPGVGVPRARPATSASASASSTSESGNASPAPATETAPGPGLSPTSSMGSLTSDKSTLNPHAKAIVVFVITIHSYAFEKSGLEEVSMVALSGCVWLQAFVVTLETK